MSQPVSHPTLINLPQPPSNPDTPSEMPGTPTSTTTSLSALSTTAIKDGHRGHALPTTGHRGHQHHSSTNSLDAERADRISRLTGLSSISGLRAPIGSHQSQHNASLQTTPTSTGFPGNVPPQVLGVPAYFDSNGQPVAVTKMSTVGTASATESVGGRTATDLSGVGQNDDGDQDMRDEEMSLDTNFREMDSVSGYMGQGPPDIDPMDEDLTNRSVGGYEDRMSDDGSASLVGFGEGANSTISGPIYVRRPLPGGIGLERSASGLSEGATLSRQRFGDREGGETPISVAAALERRDARMVDGVATDGVHVPAGAAAADEDIFVDTTTRGPVPVGSVQPGQPSAIRETQQPHSHQHQQSSTAREDAERLVRERLERGESRTSNTAMGASGVGGERLGRFYFEERK
ncbi:hypothetical protein UCRPA7_1070 [Phaeoacremonium minimum UCRPA7]|uniref:Uncharacterized protein n=1 Tax=Phaeoacremonium minimum (strain UCR-PA7) TaxID=1286976 RepID=R8BVL7_PHAM7|nr:hypothetical protein UCRPA7_1070 [Phaeoacremonium minimum UCRPA7]EOO03403.1 hypothetical protein UCRPA7_1070 [Phaeoacremonium minimum UCRPA7]